MWRAVGGAVAYVFIAVIIIPALVVGGAFGPGLVPTDRASGHGPTIRVRHDPDGQVEVMALEDYVKGVVAAEMPANFEVEALKAQAVVARTLAVRRMRSFGGAGLTDDPRADVSTDPAKGQAWSSVTELRQRWGAADFNALWGKISQAVESTEGLIITYDHLPIDAQFHSTSAGPTENSEDVWTEKIPYLRSVPCEWDQESPHYSSTVRLRLSDVAAKVPGSGQLAVPTATGKTQPVEVLERTAAGRVKTVRVGAKTVRGIDFRLALGLKSANFTVTFQGSEAVFQVKGYGHGVGLCQYGTNGLAKLGRSYEDIIKYYYTGVTIEKLSGQ
ncbi:MAG: stage II sporulation protein D [Bacillota bacterium]